MTATATTPANTPTPKSCREALHWFASGKGRGVSAEDRAACARLASFMDRRPLLGLWVQHLILAHYQAAHNTEDFAAEINWIEVVTWMQDNLPTILRILLSLLAVFGV